MDLRVEGHEQVDQSDSFGVKERRPKSGKSRASSWTVEIRSKLLKPSGKIWVGSFKTREEANKACDAALHHLHRPTHYYTYPTSGYFCEVAKLPQDERELKDRVKFLAKEYAQRPLRIIATTAPSIVASQDSAPDDLALQIFRANATFRDVCEVGGAHNSAAYGMGSPCVPASSSSFPRMARLNQLLEDEDPEPEDQSLKASDEYKHLYGELYLACCETPAREAGEGSSDVAINSANKEAANDIIGSIDSPLASVPRLQAHRRSHSPEFAKIEDTDKPDQLAHADMCKSTPD